MPEFIPLAAEMIMQHEGFRGQMYKCSEGYWTIGYGLNLEADGITKEEAEIILVNRIIRCLDDLESFRWWEGLNDARKAAITNMRYQLGATGFRKFKKTLQYLELSLFAHAANEMLNSLWAKQTPNRAADISKIIRDGVL